MGDFPSQPFTMFNVRETDRPHDGSPLSQFAARLPPLPHGRWFGYVFGVAAVVLVSALLELLLPQTRLGNASTIYALSSW